MPRSSPRLRRARACAAAVLLALALAVGVVVNVPATGAARTTGWLHTKGSRILDSRNADHVIRATSWFGMETANCAPHGLWQIPLDQGLDEIASFGFNAIRLPYSNECLASKSITGVDYHLNPTLEGRTPLQVLDIVVARAKAHGLSIILDRHRPDSAAQSPLWYTAQYSEARWISDWTMLAKRYASDPTVIGVDLHNEPHGDACWGCADPKRDWAAAATRAGNAVLAVNPRLLIIVEGVEKQSTGTTWWGGGLADAKKHPVRLKVAHRLVYSTHDYPVSVFAQPWFSAKSYPKNLPGLWKASWGYLQTKGTTPVLLGEFGTKLETTSDKQWLAALVSYVRKNKMSFAYWSFNPNSGDTGGLVTDDWVTPQEAKLTALRPILGPRKPFTPASPTKPTPSPTPSASPTPTRSATPTPTPTSAAPTAAPTSTSPAPTTSTSTSTSTSENGLAVDYRTQSAWPGGYVAELALTADQARDGWTVRWADPAATSVVNAWGMTCAATDGAVECRGTDWGARLAAGQTVRVGVQLGSAGTAPATPDLVVS